MKNDGWYKYVFAMAKNAELKKKIKRIQTNRGRKKTKIILKLSQVLFIIIFVNLQLMGCVLTS